MRKLSEKERHKLDNEINEAKYEVLRKWGFTEDEISSIKIQDKMREKQIDNQIKLHKSQVKLNRA